VTGRTLALGLVGFAIIFGVALWWFQTRAFYEEVSAEAVEIGGASYPVADWQGIDASTSPLKFRACARFTSDVAARLRAEQTPDDGATPLVAPGWFECFDAEAISTALGAGEAEAFIRGPSPFDGVNDWIALMPDGRAYLWRQLTPEFAEQ